MCRCLVAAVLLLLGAGAPASAQAQAQAPEVFSYRIEHETWGDIGSFSNTIRREGGRTEVEARLRIKVTALFGIVLHREEADRRETWEDGRLIAYESVTDVNGDTVRLSGQASGEVFAIQGPRGEAKAPLDVRPTNLWSIDMSSAETVMGTKTGSLVPVAVTDGGRRGIEIDGREIAARYFRIDPRGDPGEVPFPLEGWFDDAGIPLRFAVTQEGDSIVFTLVNYREALDARAAAANRGGQ